MAALDEDAAASLVDLKDSIAEALQRRGVSQRVKARLRAEVFRVLEGRGGDEVEGAGPGAEELLRPRGGAEGLCAGVPAPPMPPNIMVLVNELFREYLVENGFESTLSVFMEESGSMMAASGGEPEEDEGESERERRKRRPLLQRKLMEQELGLRMSPSSAHHALIYGVVQYLRERNRPLPAQGRGGVDAVHGTGRGATIGDRAATATGTGSRGRTQDMGWEERDRHTGDLRAGYEEVVDVQSVQQQGQPIPLQFSGQP